MASAVAAGLKSLSLDDNYLLVAGIDFGTTFSAYAFSFKSSQDEIRMNKNWGAELGCETYKVPTCVMTNPDGTFHSFGYNAEKEYNELDEDEVVIGGPNGYNLYRHFKMLLHKQGAKLSSKVTSTSGHVAKAIDIFSMALRYLKDHMLAAINKAVVSPVNTKDIRWVLTVPAIWTDESKRFMREAAFEAELIPEVNSNQLLIALEPEAASMFCRKIDVKGFASSFEEKDNVRFKTGDKILVVDAGGGTVDITAHEVQITGQVKEIAPPSGGPWGGTCVDKKFETVLCKIFGTDFLNNFKATYPQQWTGIVLQFEKLKKGAKPDGKSTLKIPIPFNFESECHKVKGDGLAAVVKKSQVKNVSFNNGFLILKYPLVEEIFRDSIDQIMSCVKDIKSDQRVIGLKYILLVGGFGEGNFLQDACEKAFGSTTKVLTPMEAQLAVIKGASQFGHNPLQVTSRISKMTYGCRGYDHFQENVHNECKKVIKYDGSMLAKDVFHVFVTCGEEIQTGYQKSMNFSKTKENQKSMIFYIYKTIKKEPIHTDEDQIVHLGKTRIESPNVIDKVELRFTFGHTEILVEARETSKGEDFPVKTTIDFLSD